MIPNILVMGSCRVHGPTSEIATTGRCQYYDGGSKAYLHSVREAVQRLRWSRRECKIDDALAPYFFATETTPTLKETNLKQLDDCDILVVEIASEKELICDGLYLQLNYLHRHLLSALGGLGTAWWREVVSKGRASDELIATILESEYFSESGFGVADANVLRNTFCVMTSTDSIAEGLQDLKALWKKPIAIISHVGLPLLDGKVLKARENFIERLKVAATQVDLPVFEPGPLVTQVGRKLALEREGADVDHYNPDFEQIYGWYLVNRVIKPILEAQPVRHA